MLGLYIEVFQIPACVLLLVQLPPRNHLCLMEFLIVCPEFEKLTKLKQLEIFRSAVGRRQKKVLHVSLPHAGNTTGCFLNGYRDVVTFKVNNSSNAVNLLRHE